MPWIIEYNAVLEQMHRQQFKSLYYNSGAFGFSDSAAVKHLAWIGPDDPTIRPAALPLTRRISPPWEPTLTKLASQVWQQHLPGKLWLMPMSHWAFELSHGSREWLPELVESIGLDPGLLEGRNNAAAIEFSSRDVESFELFIERLLERLSSSDFMIAFPGRPVLCTVHHHKQLWWQTTQDDVLSALEVDVDAE